MRTRGEDADVEMQRSYPHPPVGVGGFYQPVVTVSAS